MNQILYSISDDVFVTFARYQDELYINLVSITAALADGKIPYALVGGYGVLEWARSAEDTAERFTGNLDFLMHRTKWVAAEVVLHKFGYVTSAEPVPHAGQILRRAVAPKHSRVTLLPSGERLRAGYKSVAPNLSRTLKTDAGVTLLQLEPLVEMKLTSFRIIDQVHLQDLVGVGLVDGGWPAKYPSPLAERLQQIIDNPEA